MRALRRQLVHQFLPQVVKRAATVKAALKAAAIASSCGGGHSRPALTNAAGSDDYLPKPYRRRLRVRRRRKGGQRAVRCSGLPRTWPPSYADGSKGSEWRNNQLRLFHADNPPAHATNL